MDDEKITLFKRLKLLFKIAGIVLLAGGLTLVVVAFVDFFSNIMADDMKPPEMFWMFFVGFPALAFGGTFAILGFRK